MISAFGVHHGVSKSFVGGKFVSASALSAKQAGKVRAGGQWKKARGRSQEDTAFKERMAHESTTNLLQNASGIKVDRAAVGGSKHGGQGGTIRLGSKSGGQSYVSGVAGSKKGAEKIGQHEAQHALPNRSSYRLHGQILPNRGKLMREEARADWHSFGHYSNRDNPGMYAAGARATAGKPGAQHKFGTADKDAIKAQGMKPKDVKMTNAQARGAITQTMRQIMPHYPGGKKVFKPYQKLQDDLQRRGVAQRPRTFQSKPIGT